MGLEFSHAAADDGHIDSDATDDGYPAIRFDAGFNASPAFVGNAMIVRTFTHLYRIEKRN